MEQTTGGLDLVLLGRTGAGKSASGNTILGREAFKSKKSSRSVTKDVAVESGTVNGFPVTVYDTPGLFDTELSEQEIEQKYANVLQKCNSDLCAFLLVIKADRFTEEEIKTVEKIEKLLGEERLKKTWILFTRGDELEEENFTIKEFIDDTEPLKKLIQKYDQRYHVFNNKKRGHTGQVKMLLAKILKPYLYTIEGADILKQNPLMRKILDNIEPDAPVSSLSSRRIVLLGKTGVGKSAAGNTILGQREFNSVQRMNSVTSKSSVKHATVSGRSVSVVDTPGLFDTQMKTEDLMMEIATSVYISSPGPHAFLIVFPVNTRFTEHEQDIPQMIEMMFGAEVLKYSIILFTQGDQLEGETVEKLIEESSRLRDLVDQCGGRFHVFNNRDVNNRDQVNDLLKKIDTMIEENGGGHYSNQMYEDAQRFRREEEERRHREEEERKQQEKQRQDEEKRRREEIEEKRRREEIESVRKETGERMRAEFEAQLKSEQERRVTRQREDEERKQHEKKRRDENERLIKEEEETMTGFDKFLSKYKYYILAGLVVGGLVCAGVCAGVGAGLGAGVGAILVKFGVLTCTVSKVALVGAGVGAVAGVVAGVGVGVGVGARQKEIERVVKETRERMRTEFEDRLKSEQEKIIAARQREDDERKQQEKQRLDEIERGIKLTGENQSKDYYI